MFFQNSQGGQMGYLAWIIALISLLFVNTAGMPANAVIASLLHAYVVANTIFLIITGILFLLSLFSGDENAGCLFGFVFVMRLVVFGAALAMAGIATVEGMTDPTLFWIMFIISVLLGIF